MSQRAISVNEVIPYLVLDAHYEKVRIKDPSFLLLVRKFLKAGYVDAGKFVLTTNRTPQGGDISPILSNIFLHRLLDLWLKAKRNIFSFLPQAHKVDERAKKLAHRKLSVLIFLIEGENRTQRHAL